MRPPAGSTGTTLDGRPARCRKAVGTGDFNKDGDADILWRRPGLGLGNGRRHADRRWPGRQSRKRVGTRSGLVRAAPTSCSRTQAKSRSGTWTEPLGLAAGRSAPMPGELASGRAGLTQSSPKRCLELRISRVTGSFLREAQSPAAGRRSMRRLVERRCLRPVIPSGRRGNRSKPPAKAENSEKNDQKCD
jgi:hypothetical protein